MPDAEDLDLLRRRIMNVVGHELRTPVTTLAGLVAALEDADEGQIRDEIAPALRRGTDRLERLLDDLLVAAGVVTALPVGDPETVSVGLAIAEAWASAAGAVPLPVEGDANVAVRAHLGSLGRIFGAVLENAIRYGDGDPRVRVEPGHPVVRVDVESSGAAVDVAEIRLATEAFWRGERAVTAAPGLGLGLSVARALAEHDGGSVSVTAGATGGVVTTITLVAA